MKPRLVSKDGKDIDSIPVAKNSLIWATFYALKKIGLPPENLSVFFPEEEDNQVAVIYLRDGLPPFSIGCGYPDGKPDEARRSFLAFAGQCERGEFSAAQFDAMWAASPLRENLEAIVGAILKAGLKDELRRDGEGPRIAIEVEKPLVH